MDDEGFIFRFLPIGDGPPAEIRVRRMLKTALRVHKLRASWAGISTQPVTTHTPGPERAFAGRSAVVPVIGSTGDNATENAVCRSNQLTEVTVEIPEF
jgi:hypothetical protein